MRLLKFAYELLRYAIYAGYLLVGWQIVDAIRFDAVSPRWVGIGIATILVPMIIRGLIMLWVRIQRDKALDELFSKAEEMMREAEKANRE